MKAIKSNEPGFGAYARLSFCALCFLSSQHRYKSTTRPGRLSELGCYVKVEVDVLCALSVLKSVTVSVEVKSNVEL